MYLYIYVRVLSTINAIEKKEKKESERVRAFPAAM